MELVGYLGIIWYNAVMTDMLKSRPARKVHLKF